jgi:hypothetical protein
MFDDQKHARLLLTQLQKKQLMDMSKKGEGYDRNQTRQFGNTRV